KILKMVASKLGIDKDVAVYENDVQRLTNALTEYSWDKESGYFSYVLHNENYEPQGFMLTEDGENLNKGLDGIYPIIAGVCNEEQSEKIIAHLTDEKEMHSPYGISAVDMTASYYMVNGYWNGNIWFPHQWFIFKSMLDMGRGEIARDIAHMALNIWKREVDSSYYTFEMVNTVTGCGGWFHNFGGLSTPINMWFKAYYCPGTVNVGFDTFIEKYQFNEDYTEAEIVFTYYGDKEKFTLLSVMNEKENYTATLDGKEISIFSDKGQIEIELHSKYKATHTIIIRRK
ncbi:MAG: hypothetical protein IIW88_06305, partial [Clostridia bacterium]|nr:hypothetical protein [Clostridia bacterium]